MLGSGKGLARLGLACLLALCVGTAEADIIGISGDGDLLVPAVTPPGDVKADYNTGYTANFFNNTGAGILIHGWGEVRNTALSQAVKVDAVAPGTYDSEASLGTFTLAAGTVIDSDYFYLDPKNGASRSATFTFAGTILGVIVESDRRDDDRFLESDFLRNPNSYYPTPFAHFDNRGLEMKVDAFTISADRRSITLNLNASSPGDQVRVLTLAVPEPSSLAVLASGVALVGGLGLRRTGRDRRAV